MSLVIIHLSDIHIKSDHDPILKESDNIASCAFASLADASHLILMVSGDIAFSVVCGCNAFASSC